MSGLVTLWKFRDLPEALLAKSKLESEGITAFLVNDEMIRMDWFWSNLIGGIWLQVPEPEAARALELLQEPIPDSLTVDESSPAYMQPRCPKCGSLDVEDLGSGSVISVGTWLNSTFNLHSKTDAWHCSDCGHNWQNAQQDDPVDVSPEASTCVFVATTNLGKLKDFSAAAGLGGLNVAPFPADRRPPEVEEDGDTFEANAIKKAEAYSACLPNELIIADDSGLEVTALNGAPGVYSARFAQTGARPNPSDSDNNYKLLYEMSLHPEAARTARFVCVIAAARDGRVLQTFRGEVRGEILPTPIGRHGFGYDPLFFVPQADKTFAEMGTEEKAEYSHRGRAFRDFMDWLKPEISRS